MYKDIFSRLFSLVIKPAEAWDKLRRREEDEETFLSRFVYPLIGLMALAAFVGVLFTRKEFDFQVALKSSIMILVSSFGGFFLGVYMMNEVWQSFFKQPKDTKLIRYFVGYSSSLMFLLNILLALLPEFIFLRVFVLYTVYIIWEGAVSYMGIAEDQRFKFTAIASVLVLATPMAIELFLRMLMPGLRY
ncbi:MAG: YIP1 family protein [Tannerella sp.]|jgi:hypothetical protein|nr:YIP1 family protein [Tannerella sp.]